MIVDFRKAHNDDAVILVEAAGRALAEDERIYGSVDTQYRSASIHQHFIEVAHYFVDASTGRVVTGACAIDRGQSQYEIGIIYVDPAVQNQGVGRQMLRYIETQFPWVTRWYWDTGHLNYRNHHFYKTLGYHRAGTAKKENNGYYKVIFEKII